MARLAFVLLIALAITAPQVTSASGLVQDIEKVFKEAFDKSVNEIEYIMEKLKAFFKSVLEQKTVELSEIADFAIQQVELDESLDQACKDDIKQKIQSHKSTGISSFFSCSNLTDAMVETGSIIVFSLELTANVTENFNAIFDRLSACSTESIIKKPYCWFQAVLDMKSDIEKDVSDISYFKAKVTKLAGDIKDNIEYCSNPPKKNMTVAIQHAMDSSKNCQTKPIAH